MSSSTSSGSVSWMAAKQLLLAAFWARTRFWALPRWPFDESLAMYWNWTWRP